MLLLPNISWPRAIAWTRTALAALALVTSYLFSSPGESQLIYAVLGVYLIDTRATLLDATSLIEQAALDRYQFTRDAYFQLRTNLQYEGNPPAPQLEDESGESGPGGTKTKPAQPPPQDQR